MTTTAAIALTIAAFLGSAWSALICLAACAIARKRRNPFKKSVDA